MGCNLFGGLECNRRCCRDEFERRRFYPERRGLSPGRDFREDFRDRRCSGCRPIFPRLF